MAKIITILAILILEKCRGSNILKVSIDVTPNPFAMTRLFERPVSGKHQDRLTVDKKPTGTDMYFMTRFEKF